MLVCPPGGEPTGLSALPRAPVPMAFWYLAQEGEKPSAGACDGIATVRKSLTGWRGTWVRPSRTLGPTPRCATNGPSAGPNVLRQNGLRQGAVYPAAAPARDVRLVVAAAGTSSWHPAAVVQLCSGVPGRASGLCLAVYGEGDRDACPGREHERVAGLTEPAGSYGRVQRGDRPGGVGTLEVFCQVGDPVSRYA